MVAVVKTVLRLAWACFLFVRNEREEELFLAPINKTTYSENMQMMGEADNFKDAIMETSVKDSIEKRTREANNSKQIYGTKQKRSKPWQSVEPDRIRRAHPMIWHDVD